MPLVAGEPAKRWLAVDPTAPPLLNNRLASVCVVLAGINGAIAVAAGAYGRHGLADAYPREIVAIAADYQLAHALALGGLACLAELLDVRGASAAGAAAGAFSLGIILFSGTLYALGITGFLIAPGAAPAGGILLIAGWLTLAFIGIRSFLAPKSR